MYFQGMYVMMITEAPNREKAEVTLISLRFRGVFPIGPKPSVVGVESVELVAMSGTNELLSWLNGPAK